MVGDAGKKWLVFYTQSRAEKKVFQYLERFGFTPYLPLQKVMRQWSDRKKKVEVPLFSSYIFVLDHEFNIPEILKIPGISWPIKHSGQPAFLRENEIDIIRRFLSTGLLIEKQTLENLSTGDIVEVIDGPLRGIKGLLFDDFNESKFIVVLENINQGIKVTIDKHLLRKCK